MTLVNDLQKFNSTSYADVLGVQFGLPRLPGESTTAYVVRLSQATSNKRDHSLPGMVNQISLSLGLSMSPFITIASNDITAVVNVGPGGVVLTSTSGTATIPVVTVGKDNVWVWNTLSNIVASINLTSVFTATLLVPDAPALQLAPQKNNFYQLNEIVVGAQVKLDKTGIVVGTEYFNNVNIPNYVLTSDGTLSFAWQPPDNLTISYQYKVWPYDIVGSAVGLIDMLDPSFLTIAQAADGALVHQVQEIVQAIMAIDRSYWAK